MPEAPQTVVSFKADRELLRLLKGVRNRSAFIRDAVIAALGEHCPLCLGSGTVSSEERQRWVEFAAHHPVAECSRCHQHVFTCHRRPVKHACRH
jgi:hypothetical protein